ncbi:hypothetical protein NQH46_12205 [Enterobacter wuhouensis]|uniref:hypothetical protein n=1 Tax=Enterobacter wuhouensis TaxID=2529381 RepID=UPI0021E58D54|nr:hypothetical protein [Enterobacter wuhouensis]MCV2533858.1 hypothetical protein [Enterobacter wuhouensis]
MTSNNEGLNGVGNSGNDGGGNIASNDPLIAGVILSNEELIYNKLCELYPHELKPITELSRNTTGNRDFICSPILGLDFDHVLNVSDKYADPSNEKSPDSVFYYNSTLYFIEFKEGDCNKIDIRTKIHEAINTLYMFVLKYLPDISRQDFFDLNIFYGVFARDLKANLSNSAFRAALNNSSQKFNLRNIEGMIVKKTKYSTNPQYIVDFLSKVTNGQVSQIDVFEYLKQPNVYITFNAST